MGRRFWLVAGVFLVAFAAAQLIRPDRANPATDANRTIRAHLGNSGAVAVLERACNDCHSNDTIWPRYTQVAPVSWLMARGVAEGRKAVNFSEWGAYSPAQRQVLLDASCQDVSDGRMPGVYAWVRPETRLSARDVETICAAAHQTDAHDAGVSQ
jgi:hypothetical protein